MPYVDREKQRLYWSEYHKKRWANDPVIRERQAQRVQRNADKIKKQKQVWHQRTKNTKRTYEIYIGKTYGLTLVDVSRMIVEQNGCCGICGKDEPGGMWNRWCIDHNHTTGAVRGLLCNTCNKALGQYETRRTSIDGYLAKYETHQ